MATGPRRRVSPEDGPVPPKRPKTDALQPQVHCHDARTLTTVVAANSVHLVVTSPPYPMVAMWDELFRTLCPDIPPPDQWKTDDALRVWEHMHGELDKVWDGLACVMVAGGMVAINIGDAYRSVDGDFRRFCNAARVIQGMTQAGFTPLPSIYWKKATNKPNKFMGSGFQPPNAYVTADCEEILLFRKNRLRRFPPNDPQRAASSFTREQRDRWFTQIWEGIPGAPQDTATHRRSAAFPMEIPTRLVHMFSVLGDVVLDPFVGTGTTLLAAWRAGRASIGLEKDPVFAAMAREYCAQPPVGVPVVEQ
jgi:modification methylase